MNDKPDQQKNLIDTTDSLEAIAVFRGWKNLLFFILLLSMIILQAAFWLLNTGYITKDTTARAGIKTGVTTLAVTDQNTPANSATQEEQTTKSVEKKPANEIRKEQIEQAAKQVTSQAQPPAAPNEATAIQTTQQEPAEAAAQPEKPSKAAIIDFGQLGWLIHLVNWIIVFTSILYCLTLVFGLKVSLVGRLGGINHIARAFYWSLIFTVLLMPWQKFFAGVFNGYLSSPHEMLAACQAAKGADIWAQSLFYLRYVGFWAILLILLIVAQSRSSRWIKATYHRLEVI